MNETLEAHDGQDVGLREVLTEALDNILLHHLYVAVFTYNGHTWRLQTKNDDGHRTIIIEAIGKIR